MATLRDVLETVSGLYREPAGGQGHERQELLSKLPGETLQREVRVERLEPGIYTITSNGQAVFELLSRRRLRRDAQERL